VRLTLTVNLGRLMDSRRNLIERIACDTTLTTVPSSKSSCRASIRKARWSLTRMELGFILENRGRDREEPQLRMIKNQR
jgi:hypothetical protein